MVRVFGMFIFHFSISHSHPSHLTPPPSPLPKASAMTNQNPRKEQKRSHTLRYVLKNRATDRVLFVVLFTLYLKEDVDEEGNVKEGVESGVPFELRGEEERGRYEGAKDG